MKLIISITNVDRCTKSDLLEEGLRFAQDVLQLSELEEVAVQRLRVRIDLIELRLEALECGLRAPNTFRYTYLGAQC